MKFECKRCGACCRGRGYVYLDNEDVVNLATHFNLATSEFQRIVCTKAGGKLVIKSEGIECRFLDGNNCFIYDARPKQCKTWPHWKENIVKDEFKESVKERCKGCLE